MYCNNTLQLYDTKCIKCNYYPKKIMSIIFQSVDKVGIVCEFTQRFVHLGRNNLYHVRFFQFNFSSQPGE